MMNWGRGLALGLGALAMGSAAGDWSLSEWLKALDARLRRTEERYQSQAVAAAAVRGEEKQAPPTLYWKGREKREATPGEVAALMGAVALAQEGKTKEAGEALEKFLSDFPGSPLAPEARKTRSLLAADPEAAP